jgi:hypothetical protein
MDFDQAAKCMLELQSQKARAQGAAHQLDCDVASSQELSHEEKVALQQTISRLFHAFGRLDCGALDELHKTLMKYEDYVRAWVVRSLQGNRPNE